MEQGCQRNKNALLVWNFSLWHLQVNESIKKHFIVMDVMDLCIQWYTNLPSLCCGNVSPERNDSIRCKSFALICFISSDKREWETKRETLRSPKEKTSLHRIIVKVRISFHWCTNCKNTDYGFWRAKGSSYHKIGSKQILTETFEYVRQHFVQAEHLINPSKECMTY